VDPRISKRNLEEVVFKVHSRGKFTTNLSPNGRIRQVQNTTSCHNFDTINLNLNLVIKVIINQSDTLVSKNNLQCLWASPCPRTNKFQQSSQESPLLPRNIAPDSNGARKGIIHPGCPPSIVTEILFWQCTFLKLNFNRLGSRSQTSALDERDTKPAKTMAKIELCG